MIGLLISMCRENLIYQESFTGSAFVPPSGPKSISYTRAVSAQIRVYVDRNRTLRINSPWAGYTFYIYIDVRRKCVHPSAVSNLRTTNRPLISPFGPICKALVSLKTVVLRNISFTFAYI